MALWSDEASVEVAAPPERVWALVSDVTRMGEWSPACHACEWLGEVQAPHVGARFVGHNKLNGARWSRECVVTAAEPGREFAFTTTFGGDEQTKWRYTFEPTSSGTRVVERYEVASLPTWIKLIRLVPGMPKKSLRDGQRSMTVTLERLKAAAEG